MAGRWLCIALVFISRVTVRLSYLSWTAPFCGLSLFHCRVGLCVDDRPRPRIAHEAIGPKCLVPSREVKLHDLRTDSCSIYRSDLLEKDLCFMMHAAFRIPLFTSAASMWPPSVELMNFHTDLMVSMKSPHNTLIIAPYLCFLRIIISFRHYNFFFPCNFIRYTAVSSSLSRGVEILGLGSLGAAFTFGVCGNIFCCLCCLHLHSLGYCLFIVKCSGFRWSTVLLPCLVV